MSKGQELFMACCRAYHEAYAAESASGANRTQADRAGRAAVALTIYCSDSQQDGNPRASDPSVSGHHADTIPNPRASEDSVPRKQGGC